MPSEACQTVGLKPDSARECSLPFYLDSKKLQMETACWTILGAIGLFCKKSPSKQILFQQLSNLDEEMHQEL